jgi:hypothetical protein
MAAFRRLRHHWNGVFFMNKLFAGALLLSISAAAPVFGQGATASLYGTWTMDFKKTIEVVKAEGGDEKSVDPSAEVEEVTLQFTPDGKLQMVQREEGEMIAVGGTWKVTDEAPMKLTLEVRLQFEGDDEPVPVRIRFLDRNTLRLDFDDDSEVMVFRRSAERMRVGTDSHPPRSPL